MNNLSTWKTMFLLCVFCGVEAVAALAPPPRTLGLRQALTS
jgi:hypothetical protein